MSSGGRFGSTGAQMAGTKGALIGQLAKILRDHQGIADGVFLQCS